MTNTQFLDLPGGRLAYDIDGDGPLVVCMTGMGDIRSQFRFLTPALLEAGYRVATVDTRGFGESTADWPSYTRADVAADALALIRHLGGPAVLVANSYTGGSIAAASVLDPSLVSGIVLLAGFIREPEPTISRRVLARVMASAPLRIAWPAYYRSLYVSTKPDDLAAHIERIRANLREPGRWRALGQMLLSDNRANDALVSKVTVPALVVMGSRDSDFADPAAEIDYARQQFTGPVESLFLEGVGHYPHVEQPAPTTAAIVEFLEQVCHAKA